jgi:chromosome segregation ATPase
VRAQAEALKGQIESFEMETQDLQKRLHNKTAEVQLLSDMLAGERSKSDQFNTRIGELDRQLIAQMTESELLVRRVAELTARLDEQGRFLADREYDADRLRNEVSTAQKTEAEVRAALAEAENRHHSAPQRSPAVR